MSINLARRGAFKLKLMWFHAISREERLAHFDEFAPGMCSDEWRTKFREFIANVTPETVARHQELRDEVCNHACIEGSLFRETEELPGCRKCRDAFWNMVEKTALER